MKKLLAMVLALVMTLSLAVSASAFKDDKDVSDTYAEAVAVLNGMGVFKGYEDGSFQPKGDITRAEVAAIVYRVYTQDVKDAKASLYATYNKFSDMTGAGWAAGYIGYCANAELVKGYPNGTFQPSGKVTGYEVLAMILRAIGYDKNGEFSGADWALHVAQTAQQAGILDNVKGVDLNAPATRELVAELLFRAIAEAPMVTYTAAFGYQTVSFSGSKNDSKLFKDNETLGHKNFELTPNDVNGDYGRPATKWTYNVGDEKTTVYDKPVATYTEAVTACDLCKDLSEKKEANVVLSYTDGVKSTTPVTYKSTDTKTKLGAQGQLVEVYENGDDYTVIAINTYLAKVTKVIEEVKDSNDHVKVEASVNVDVYGTKTSSGVVTVDVVKDSFETTGFAKNDYVLVTYDDGDIASMEAAKGEVAKLTGLEGNKLSTKTTYDVQDILAVAYEDVKVAVKATLNPFANGERASITLNDSYTFYYDSYGNVIGVGDYTEDANYVVIDRIWADHDNGKVTVYADLVNVSDASVLSKVTVDSVKGTVLDVTVNQDDEKNSAFYEDLMTYTVNKDGEYELTNTGVKVQTSAKKNILCTYDASDDKYVINVNQAETGNVYMDKDTEILIQFTNAPEGTYKAYTLDTLPDSFWGYVEYVVGSDGRADVVYVRGAEQTYSYVFIASTDYQTRTNADKTVTLTLKDAYALNEDGTLGDKVLTLTSGSENIVINETLGNNKFEDSTKLNKAGLYQLYTLGENDQLLKYVAPVQLQAVNEYGNNEVLGLYTAGKLTSLDSSVKTFAWEGKFTQVGTLGNPQAAKFTEVDDNSELADLHVGDYVYVQMDSKDKDVVAIHKVNFEVSVQVGDADAKYGYGEYYGDAFKDIVVSCDDKTGMTVTMNGQALSDNLTISDVKNGKVTVSYDGEVTGDIVITVAGGATAEERQAKADARAAAVDGKEITVKVNEGEGTTTDKIVAALRALLVSTNTENETDAAGAVFNVGDYRVDSGTTGQQTVDVPVTAENYGYTANATVKVIFQF